jgi:hypothetical protein
VIHNLKEQEKLRKQFEEAVEFEVRNGRFRWRNYP